MRRYVGVRAETARRLRLCAGAGLCALLLPVAGRAWAAEGEHRKPIWIDTDPACGQGKTADVDDCWALLLAIRSRELEIRGISTVFGNVDGATAWAVAGAAVNRFGREADLAPVYRGADRAGGGADSEAIGALAAALQRGRLTILALGPLTNLAALLASQPQLAGNIDRIVAVAGTRPSQRRLFPGPGALLHFHDLNFVKDPAAFETVLQMAVPLTLLPFEAAQQVTVSPDDLSALAYGDPRARWLAAESQGWMRFWTERLGVAGFHPFDSLAVGYVIEPLDFTCERTPVRVSRSRSLFAVRDALEVADGSESAEFVTYCSGVDPGFKEALLARLGGSVHRLSQADSRRSE